MDRAEQAISNFKEGYNCSQALLLAFQDVFGIDRETILKLAAPFGGGIGRLGETCGAVTGALMIIGLKYGNTGLEPLAKEKMYGIVNDFVENFKERNNSIICKELLHCDLSTMEGFKEARDKRLIPSLCPKFVKDAVEIAEELLK
ncbi:MAG: C_GCAxxG_C_C family protein [Nitrospirae bacterium]|nr:C_GCAxxG_C_C family protein [Nitrospirota bacterium]